MFAVVASVMAQSVVYKGQISDFSVEQKPGESYSWDIYKDSTVNFAKTPGDVLPTEAIFVNGNTGPEIQIEWLEAGIYFVKVTATNECTNNLEIARIEVLESLPEATITGDSICIGDPAFLTVELTGEAPWNITYTDGSESWTINNINETPYTIAIDPGPVGTTEYWITQITDSNGTNNEPTEKAEVKVYPKPAISRIYQYDN